MAYEIVFDEDAKREYLALPRRLRRLIRPAIHALASDPRRPPHVAAEEMFWGEWEGYWRVRVGEFRVIYDIDDRPERVTILRIRHRSDAYEGGPGRLG